MTPLLQPELFGVLVRGLDEAVKADPSLDAARRQLLLPVHLLDALAAQTPGTLGDDPLAMERLRLLLTSASAHAMPASAAQVLATSVSAPPASARTTASSSKSKARARASAISTQTTKGTPFACPPGLLHVGWLVLVGLAAGRAGKLMLNLETPFIQTVHGLALATGPAETLASALAAGLSGEHVRVLLAALTSPPEQDTQSSGLSQAIASFLSDPLQRLRWACISYLFSMVDSDVKDMQWEGASAEGIASVRPRVACPGEETQLRGMFSLQLVGNLLKDQQQVVFAAPGEEKLRVAPVLKAIPGPNSSEGNTLYYEAISVEVPTDVRPGWVGFTDPAMRKQAAEMRESLREHWKERNESEACLADMPVPVELIAPMPKEPAPPLLGINAFKGGKPRIVELTLTPEEVGPEGKLVLEWSTEGADGVKLVSNGRLPDGGMPGGGKLPLPPRGRMELIPRPGQTDVTAELSVANSCGSDRLGVQSRVRARIESMQVVQADRPDGVLVEDEPFDVLVSITPAKAQVEATLQVGQETFQAEHTSEGFTFHVPSKLASPGFTGTVSVAPAGAKEPDDEKPLAALTFTRPTRVVVLRMAVLDCGDKGCELQRVSREETGRALVAAQESLGVALEPIEPFWAEDAAFLSGPVDGSDAPGVERLLERLARLAAMHPGLEDATWVALLPGTGSVARHVAAEAAARVAVATVDSLAKVIPTQSPAPTPAARVLRLLGTLGSECSLSLERAREESRMRGPGGPVDSGLVVVGLDANGRELAAQPVRTTRTLGTRGFVALLPVSDDTVTVEFRTNELAIHRLARPSGAPSLSSLVLDGNALSWTASHSYAARCHATVEMQWQNAWCPVASAGPCDTKVPLPPQRLAPYDDDENPRTRLRLVLTDGWNTTTAVVDDRLTFQWPHLALRDAGEGRYWADAKERDHGDTVLPAWRLGQRTHQGWAFRVLPEETGTLTLSVGKAEDTIPVGGDTNDCGCD